MPDSGSPVRPAGSQEVRRGAWREGRMQDGLRVLADETPVALVHDATTTAVMLATPADLEDFGVGFSLTEGIVDHVDDIHDFDIVHTTLGIELRMWLAAPKAAALTARARRLAGPTGCGLCGVDSLAEAVKAPARVGEGGRLAAAEVLAAVAQLSAAQPLGAATRAVHAAGLWTPQHGVGLVREDVGRHNAL